MARGNPRGTFGLVSGRGRRGFRGRGGARYATNKKGKGDGDNEAGPSMQRADDAAKQDDKFEDVALYNEIDEKLGFARFLEGPPREGWMVNMHPV